MEFFEGLSEKTFQREPQNVQELEGFGSGVYATIEALKEMVVGGPQIGIVQHWGDRRTFINYTPRDFAYQCCTTLEGHQGTDGEEVVVMVFRIPKESE